jgi:hypothetical protein
MKSIITATAIALAASSAQASDFTNCVLESGSEAFGVKLDPVYEMIVTMQAEMLEANLLKVMYAQSVTGAKATDLVMQFMRIEGTLDADSAVVMMVAKGCAHTLGESY